MCFLPFNGLEGLEGLEGFRYAIFILAKLSSDSEG
jgi:hypothetical protein